MNEPIAAVGVCGDVATAAGDDVADDDAVAADDDVPVVVYLLWYSLPQCYTVLPQNCQKR